MNKKLRRLFFRFFPCYRRLDLRFVTYREADDLIRESHGKSESLQWIIASKEEDRNHMIGMVYIERRERITE